MNGSSPTTTFDGTSMASVLELDGRPVTVVSVATVLAVILHVGMAGAAGVAASRGELVASGATCATPSPTACPDVRHRAGERARTPPPEPELEPEKA